MEIADDAIERDSPNCKNHECRFDKMDIEQKVESKKELVEIKRKENNDVEKSRNLKISKIFKDLQKIVYR